MKLTTDESLDLMQKCLPYMDKLVLDDRTRKMAQNDRSKKFVALELMLGENRDAMYQLLSVVTDKPIDVIRKQSITATWKLLSELMDGEFLTFFTLLSVMAQAL